MLAPKLASSNGFQLDMPSGPLSVRSAPRRDRRSPRAPLAAVRARAGFGHRAAWRQRQISAWEPTRRTDPILASATSAWRTHADPPSDWGSPSDFDLLRQG